MEKYKIFIKKSAADELAKIPKKNLKKIIDRIHSLSENPRPANSQKLSVRELYRIKQGDYRIIYQIQDERLEIQIYKIGHRKEIYR